MEVLLSILTFYFMEGRIFFLSSHNEIQIQLKSWPFLDLKTFLTPRDAWNYKKKNLIDYLIS